MIFVNFKEYPSGKGEKGRRLVELCCEVAKRSGVAILPIIDGRFAGGALLNHSSRPMSFDQIRNFISRFPALKTLLCCSTMEEGKKLAVLKPSFLAYEAPELIGGRVAISVAQPKTISELVKVIKPIPVLVGAGVHQKADVVSAFKLGAVGVLISTAVMTAVEPKKVLLDLVEGFR